VKGKIQSTGGLFTFLRFHRDPPSGECLSLSGWDQKSLFSEAAVQELIMVPERGRKKKRGGKESLIC